MAAYATVDDLHAFGINKAAIANMSLVDDINPVLEAASRTVDSYLAKQMTVPLVFVGGDVKRATCIIAAWDLMSGRGFNPDAGTAEVLETRYEQIIKWLTLIAEGTVEPQPDPDEGGGAAGAASPKVTSASSRGFSARGESSRYPFQSD